jgi:hypothetical protein
MEEKLAHFLDALDEWGCDDNLERAKAILEFQRCGYDLEEYLVEAKEYALREVH